MRELLDAKGLTHALLPKVKELPSSVTTAECDLPPAPVSGTAWRQVL